jgi:hypothetical protein
MAEEKGQVHFLPDGTVMYLLPAHQEEILISQLEETPELQEELLPELRLF